MYDNFFHESNFDNQIYQNLRLIRVFYCSNYFWYIYYTLNLLMFLKYILCKHLYSYVFHILYKFKWMRIIFIFHEQILLKNKTHSEYVKILKSVHLLKLEILFKYHLCLYKVNMFSNTRFLLLHIYYSFLEYAYVYYHTFLMIAFKLLVF